MSDWRATIEAYRALCLGLRDLSGSNPRCLNVSLHGSDAVLEWYCDDDEYPTLRTATFPADLLDLDNAARRAAINARLKQLHLEEKARKAEAAADKELRERAEFARLRAKFEP